MNGKKTVHCANPECGRTKPSTFIERMISGDEGVVRENRWHCSNKCYEEVVLNDFVSRKNSGRELHSSTHPVTARSFGAALLRMGKIDWMQLEEAMETRHRNGDMPLAHYLLLSGLITRRDIIEALGRHHRVPVASIGNAALDHELLRKLPAPLVRLGGVIPLSYDSRLRKLNLMMKDPSDLTTLLTVRRLLDCNVQVFQGDPAEIERMLQRYYPAEHSSGAGSPQEIEEQMALAN